MHPFYRHMDSYPHMRDQLPNSTLYHPTFLSVPHYMKGISPVTYESCPHGMNYGHPYPMACHSCCNHDYFPGYYSYRSPSHHFPPPPPLHYDPVHYNPPPHYSTEQPKHEYDRYIPREFHCSGCPNHSCSQKEDLNVKIKEPDPDVEKKSDDSSVPFQFKNYPFPVVWIPPDYMKNKEAGEPIEENYGSDAMKMDGNVVQKLIPGEVEKGEQNKSIKDNNEASKPLENNAKREPSSPQKASKLPPVCLRVEPLPRKKNSNGGSRSPSPPGNRTQSEDLTNGKSKTRSQQKMQSPEQLEKNTEVGERKSKTKTIEVVDATNMDDKIEDSRQEVLTSQTTKEGGEGIIVKEDKKEPTEAKRVNLEGLSDKDKCEIGEDLGGSNAKEDKPLSQERKLERKRKNFSDAEAAVIIQSAYRGFEVRKWEPLKKLKQIARVTEQIAEVKSLIQAHESSSDIQSDDKQRVVIGETIMSLLLNLDIIQGLHPCVRDVRKSVARELVSLQEKLDALPVKKGEASSDVASEEKPVEDLSSNDRADEQLTVTGHDNISSDVIEPYPGQPPLMKGASSSTEAVETSEPNVDKSALCAFEVKIAEVPVACDVNSKKPDPRSPMDLEDYKVPDIFQVPVLETLENHEDTLEPESSLEHSLPLVPEEKDDSGLEVMNSTSMDTNRELNKFVELSKEASVKDHVADMGHVEQQLVELLEELNGKCGSEREDENNELLEEAKIRPQEAPTELKGEDDCPTYESGVVGDKAGAEKYEKILDECSVDSLKEEVVNTNDLTRALGTGEQHEDLPFPVEDVCGGELEESHNMEKKDLNIKGGVMVGTEFVPMGAMQVEGEEGSSLLATASQVSLGGNIKMECENMLMEENAKLREMVEKLVEEGRKQLTAISDLAGKVKDLEKKMSRKKKLKTRRLAIIG